MLRNNLRIQKSVKIDLKDTNYSCNLHGSNFLTFTTHDLVLVSFDSQENFFISFWRLEKYIRAFVITRQRDMPSPPTTPYNLRAY